MLQSRFSRLKLTGLPDLPEYFLEAELQRGSGLCQVALGKGQIVSVCRQTMVLLKPCCQEGRWASSQGVCLQQWWVGRSAPVLQHREGTKLV